MREGVFGKGFGGSNSTGRQRISVVSPTADSMIPEIDVNIISDEKSSPSSFQKYFEFLPDLTAEAT